MYLQAQFTLCYIVPFRNVCPKSDKKDNVFALPDGDRMLWLTMSIVKVNVNYVYNKIFIKRFLISVFVIHAFFTCVNLCSMFFLVKQGWFYSFHDLKLP